VIEHMFERSAGVQVPSVDDVHAMAAVLARVGAGLDDPGRVEMLRALERLKCAAEGAQAVVTADFDASQRAVQAAAGVAAAEQGRGVAAQVALARRESPHRGRRHLKLAGVLAHQMPCTGVGLSSGRISEWRAMILARETECLSRGDRAEVDRRLAGDLDVLEAMGDRELAAAARELAYQLDPLSFVERRRRAEADRRVTLRPAPEVMAQLGALVPVKAGVAVWAVLSREADRRRAEGDRRSRDQIMADTLVARVLNPGDSLPTPVGLMINVVVSDTVLLGDEHGLGWVERYGPVPVTCCGSGSPRTPRPAWSSGCAGCM
jgi:hypothetical protein